MTIPDGFGQASFGFSGGPVPTGAIATLGFQNVADGSASDIAGGMADVFGEEIVPLLTDSITFESVLVKLGPDETGPSATVAVSVDGELTGGAATPNVAYLVHKNTNLGGRRGRGRMFIPGVTEETVDGAGNLTSGTVSSWNTALATLLVTLATNDLPAYLLHDGPTPPTAVQTLTIDGRVATQRRRLRR